MSVFGGEKSPKKDAATYPLLLAKMRTVSNQESKSKVEQSRAQLPAILNEREKSWQSGADSRAGKGIRGAIVPEEPEAEPVGNYWAALERDLRANE